MGTTIKQARCFMWCQHVLLCKARCVYVMPSCVCQACVKQVRHVCSVCVCKVGCCDVCPVSLCVNWGAMMCVQCWNVCKVGCCDVCPLLVCVKWGTVTCVQVWLACESHGGGWTSHWAVQRHRRSGQTDSGGTALFCLFLCKPAAKCCLVLVSTVL